MSTFLCFVCHNDVNSATTEEIRDKYREVIGMNLCPFSQLCYICGHMVSKLWLFKSICLKRTLEYPVLFSEKGALNLHRSDIEMLILCDEVCLPSNRTQTLICYANDKDVTSDYVELEDDRNDSDDFKTENNNLTIPEVKLAIPEDHFVVPEDNLDVPEGNLDIPDGNLDIPEGKLAIPEVNLAVPEGNLDIPEGNLVPEDNLAIPEDFVTASSEIEAKIAENDGIDEKIDFNDLFGGDNKGDDLKMENDDEGNDLECEGDDEDERDGESSTDTSKTKKSNKKSDKDFKKIILSLEQQKAELDSQRRSKKYAEAEFKCYNCAQGFLFKDSYQTHMMRHEESNGEYVCLLCTLRFANLAVLRSHRCGHRERYICLHCGVCVRKRQRQTHAKKHKKIEGNAACHLCGKVFQDASGLQQHLKRFHRTKNSNRTYPCSVCGKTFNNQAAVRSHMITHIQRKFACEECPATFSSPYTLTQHKKTHSTTSSSKEHICVTCGVGYNTRKSLLAHMRKALQHQQTVFECPICSRICPNSTSLTLHIARIHSTSKDYECPRCPNKYTSRNGLVRHIRGHTSRPKTVMAQCFVCGKSFKNNSRLNRHLREVCNKEKLNEELSAYNLQQDTLLVDMGDQALGN